MIFTLSCASLYLQIPNHNGTGRYHVREKRARQERTVRHGNERPGRRSREPDYRCARPNQVIPRHASGIVRPTGGNRLCQSGDRHVGFDTLSYSSAPSSGSTKPIFRFQPKPTRLNPPPGFRLQDRGAVRYINCCMMGKTPRHAAILLSGSPVRSGRHRLGAHRRG